MEHLAISRFMREFRSGIVGGGGIAVQNDLSAEEFRAEHPPCTTGNSSHGESAADQGPVAENFRQMPTQGEKRFPTAPKVSPIPLFICYSHMDQRVLEQFTPNLKVMSIRAYVQPWSDHQLTPGEAWNPTIEERLSGAKIILFMVSTNFLASDYIRTKERPLAMKRMKDQQAVVVPVLVSHCSWPKEDFAGLENLPGKGNVVTDIYPRSKAWAQVEQGVTDLVDRIRDCW